MFPNSKLNMGHDGMSPALEWQLVMADWLWALSMQHPMQPHLG